MKCSDAIVCANNILLSLSLACVILPEPLVIFADGEETLGLRPADPSVKCKS